MMTPKTPNDTATQSKPWAIWLIAILAIALVGMAFLLIIWLKPDGESNLVNHSAINSVQTVNHNSLTTNQLVGASSAPQMSQIATPLPKSLHETQVDGEIIINDKKQLVVTAGLRRLFDYFLSAQGEESLAQIEQRVIDYIRRHTPEPAAAQAIGIFQNYVKYLDAVSALDKQTNQTKSSNKNINQNTLDINTIESRLQSVDQLQSRYFDQATKDAFLGDEQSLNTYNLSVVEASQNQQLTLEQRQAMIDRAQTTYIASFKDPNVQAKLNEQRNIGKLLEETQQLKEQGATQDQINAMRSKYVSPEAVKRLEQLDQSETEFAQRVANYKSQRQQLLGKLGNTPQAQQQILQLQQSMFSPQERLRLDVLTRQP